MIPKKKSALGFVGFVAICLAAGGIGAIATAASVDNWYLTIHKPSWNPPGWLFAPVWTTLYLIMAVAGWLIWREPGADGKKPALVLFFVQLALNALWSFVFFAWHQLGWALVEILTLWVAIVATLIAFLRIRRVAGWLLVPYLAWVSFASVLTYTIWTLNR